MAVKTPPDVEAKIVILRAAGFSLPVIADKTGVSASTAKRVVNRHPPPADNDTLDLVQEAKASLREELASDDALKGMYAALLVDTLYHIDVARNVANDALGRLKAADPKDATLVFRALAAHSTTLKNHVDTVKALAPMPEALNELPSLVVSVLTEEDVAELRRQQQESDAELTPVEPD